MHNDEVCLIFFFLSVSSKGSDNPSEKPLITIENLISFAAKLQQDLFKVNDKFENMIDKLQQNLNARERQQIQYFKRRAIF